MSEKPSFDELRADFWRDKFDLIKEIGEWEIDRVCAKCGFSLQNDPLAIYFHTGHYYKYKMTRRTWADHSCPHCFVRANYSFDQDGDIIIERLSYKVVKKKIYCYEYYKDLVL